MKVLLVPVANRPESRVAVDIACGLAEKLDANVIGCHLRPHRDAGKEYKNKGLPLFGSAEEEALRELSRKGSPSGVRGAAAMFSRQTAAAGFTESKGPRLNASKLAIWHELVGSPDKLMSIAGPLSDLTVVSRPASGGRLAQMFVQAALLQSGRPVLVLPQQQKKIPGRRIAIAWNQSPEASRTVSACMPLLTVADQVSIISCGAEDKRGPKSSHLKDYLKHWGINAKSLRTKGRHEEQELLQSYRDSKSDLLIMGAYSRSRLREVVFGGMTEKMLWNTNIPVVMQHG